MTLIDNVATTFKKIFPGVPAKLEKANDGSLIVPCLSVQYTVKVDRKINREQMRTFRFDIVYIVDNAPEVKPKTALNEALNKVIENLDVVVDENGKPFAQIMNLDCEISDDDVLHVKFDVIRRVADDTEIPIMETQIYIGEIKLNETNK